MGNVRGMFMVILCSVAGISAAAAHRPIPLPDGAQGLGLAWAPDGRALAVAYLDVAAVPRLRLISLPGGEVAWEVGLREVPIGGPIPRISRLDFSADGEMLAVGTPGLIQVLSAHEGVPVKALWLDAGTVPVGLRFLSRGGLLAVLAHADRWPTPPVGAGMRAVISFQVWDMSWEISEAAVVIGERPLPLLTRPLDAFSGDRRFFASVNLHPQEGRWLLGYLGFDGDEGRVYGLADIMPEGAANPSALAIGPDGREAALGVGTSEVKGVPLVVRFRLATGEVIGAHVPCDSTRCGVSSLTYGPDGGLLAFAAVSFESMGEIILAAVDLAANVPVITPLCRGTLPDEGLQDLLAFSPNGGELAALRGDAVYLWRLCLGALEFAVPG